MHTHKTTALINTLTETLAPVSPLRPPAWRLALWLAPALVYVAVAAFMLGIRVDINDRMAESAFLFEMLIMGTLSVSAAAASVWLCIPDMRGAKWSIPVPFVALFCFALWTFARAITEGLPAPAQIDWSHCIEEGIIMAFIPAALIFALARRGATAHPRLMAVMNMLAVGGLSYIGLRLTCGNDAILHVALYHILPFILLGAAAGALAGKLYKW